MKVSKRYTDFQLSTGYMLQYLAFHFGRLGISLEQVLSMLDWHDRYSIAYKKYIDPQQHNRAIIAEMAKLYKEGVEMVSGLRQQMKHDTQITLNADDYINLGIHDDKKTYTKATKPTTAPVLVVAEIKPRSNKFQSVTYDEAGKMRHYLPRLTQLIIKTAYSHTKPEAKDYDVAMVSSKAIFTIITPPEVKKSMKGFIKAAYRNNAGEGPYSKPLEFAIN